MLAFESGCVSLDCSLFVEWYSTTKDNPSLLEFSEKAGNMHKRIRLYWSRYFDFVYSSTPPSSVELFTGTKENMRVCPNDSCGLSFRQEASISASLNTAVAFVCHADCPCDHTLDGLCELCRLPFQNHTRGTGPGRKCASGTNGLWLHQIDMKTECPYCHFSFCEKCFLPWNVSSRDGSKAKGHAGLLCATFKGVVDYDCDEDSFRQQQQIEQRAESGKVSDRIRIAANAAAEEARLLAESGTKSCPKCGYGPVQHERGHHCHHVSCNACAFMFCFCCLDPVKLVGGCRCPIFCNELCDCPPCTTCRFEAPCDLCADATCPQDGKSPYFRMPAKDVPAFEERRQRNHEAAVRKFKANHPTWPGIRPGGFGSHDHISTAFYLLTLATPGPRKSHKYADFSVGHRKNIFRMHVATDSNESDSVTSNIDEVQAILMRLGSRQGRYYFVFVFSRINVSAEGGMVSECEARFLCTRLHGGFLQNIKKSDRAAYEILFVTFLGLSPEAGRHVLSQPFFKSFIRTGLKVAATVAVAAVMFAVPNPLAIGAAGGLFAAIKDGPVMAKHLQKKEVEETLRLLRESSHLRPLGFPAFARILRRYARSKDIVDLALSTLEMCSVLFKKFIKELIAAVDKCTSTQSEKEIMMHHVNALRSQQQERLYESGILQAFSTAITVTPSTPDIGGTILRAVNILHGIWIARSRSLVAIPSFTVDCMKQLCVRGLQTSVHTMQVTWQNGSKVHESMKAQADLFVHSLRLNCMLSQNLDAVKPHARLPDDSVNLLKQLFETHTVGIKLMYWMLLKGVSNLSCSCADSESSCLKGDSVWAHWAIFNSSCKLEEKGHLSLEECGIYFGELEGRSSLSALQCISMSAFFKAVEEGVSCASDCGAIAPRHAHHGVWRDATSKPLCDNTCSHSERVLGGHYRL